jgi:hypothetical protein
MIILIILIIILQIIIFKILTSYQNAIKNFFYKKIANPIITLILKQNLKYTRNINDYINLTVNKIYVIAHNNKFDYLLLIRI